MAKRKSTKLRELSVSEKEEIYQQHLRLVISIAKKYIGRSPDFTFEDLIQEGILGLFLAAERFNAQKGCRFSTYAFRWIKQSISRALDERGRTIRVPAYIIKLSKYVKVRKKLSQKLEREPLTEEMAVAMKITIEKVRRIERFLENPLKTSSLKIPWKNDGNGVSLELIKDPKVISPVAEASRNILKEDLEETLERSLTFQEEKIIKLRFGLKDGIDHTLREIAEEIGLSREGIRQIIKKALARLRREKRRSKKES